MIIKQITPNRVEIGDKSYKKNIVVTSKGVIYSWENKKKKISKKDLKPFLENNPEVVIISQTKRKIDEKLKKILKEKEILLLIDSQTEAINAFNLLVKRGKEGIIFLALS